MTEQTPQIDDAAPREPARLCQHCQAPMADDQDWCLSCGQAAPGRLGRRPGMRAVGTVAALTLALSGGAVAAAYAALTGSPPPPATAQVAPTPQTTTTTLPATTPPPVGAVPTPPPPSAGGSTSLPKLPDLSSSLPTTPTSPKPSGGSGATTKHPSSSKPSGGSETTTGRTTGTTTTGTTTTPAAPKAIKLDASAAQLYDPYTRATAEGDVADLFDPKASTPWFVTVADGAQAIDAGLAFDLGSKRGIREIELTTPTPGFKVEIYAADADTLPPTVLDSRWAHIKDVADIGTTTDDNSETIKLGRGTSKYRYLLLWLTKPAKSGSTIKLSSLKLLG